MWGIDVCGVGWFSPPSFFAVLPTDVETKAGGGWRGNICSSAWVGQLKEEGKRKEKRI